MELRLPLEMSPGTVDEQLNIACQKAGINPDAEFEIEKFEVIRYQEGE